MEERRGEERRGEAGQKSSVRDERLADRHRVRVRCGRGGEKIRNGGRTGEGEVAMLVETGAKAALTQ
jgi:hypothetical protein